MSSMTLAQQIITIGMCILGTMATRYLPFLIFKENKKTPEYIQYLGKFLPSAVCLLILSCIYDDLHDLQYHVLPHRSF